MRVYYHPSVGEYAKYPSFEWDYFAAVAGIGGVGVGAGSYALRKANRGSVAWGLAGALVGGIIGGALVPKKILSWFNPPPFDAPIRYPRQIPKAVVPSFIGESGQVLNFLCHHGAGSVVKDYSGLGNHGKIYGASWIDGPFGWALGFDGVDDIVEVPNSPSLQVLDATFEAWINALSLPPNHGTFLAKYHYAEGGFEVLSNGQLALYHGDGTNAETAVYSTSAIELNRWYHVAVTRYTSTKTAKLYINGGLDATRIYTLTVAKSDMPVWLGWRPDKVWEHFHGFIALPRIYNRALTGAELKHHFESTRTIFGV